MESPFRNQTLKLKRTVKLTQILAKYGFQDLKGKWASNADEKNGSSTEKISVYERIRLTIEELGPTFVKFGQTLSSREDLFPSELIVELKKLQDRVPPQDIDIHRYVADELGIDSYEYFQEIQLQPIASASIAQVYKAILNDGTPVILKIKRPDTKKTIDSDLLILKDIVALLSDYFVSIRQINLNYILAAFQKTLMEELSFINEAKNIHQFSKNFRGHPSVRCMEVYDELSNDNILCVSWIDGVKITNKATLTAFGLPLEPLVDRGLDLFLTQIFKHGFFHADPHPGNILVDEKGIISFLDLGAMGTILPNDKILLEDFIHTFIAKDVDNLVYIIKKMAIHIEIENEKTLKRDILDLFNLVSTNALENIDIKNFFSTFSNILNQNNIIMPDHVYLLVRGIVLMEGIGRELLPEMNLIEKIEPYIGKIMRERFSFENIEKEIKQKLQEGFQLLQQAPYNLRNIVQKLEQGDLAITVKNQEIKTLQKQQKKNQSTNRLLAVGCTFFIAGCLLSGMHQYQLLGLPVATWVLMTMGVIFMTYAKIRNLKID